MRYCARCNEEVTSSPTSESEADKLLEARSERELHKALSDLKRRAIHVVGPSGTEGSAVIDFLLSRGITPITAHDLAPTPEQFAEIFYRTHQWLDPTEREVALARLHASSVALRYRDRYLQGIERADLIVVPQSWFRYPENAPMQMCGLHARGNSRAENDYKRQIWFTTISTLRAHCSVWVPGMARARKTAVGCDITRTIS